MILVLCLQLSKITRRNEERVLPSSSSSSREASESSSSDRYLKVLRNLVAAITNTKVETIGGLEL